MKEKNYASMDYDNARNEIAIMRNRGKSWDDILSMKFLEELPLELSKWNDWMAGRYDPWITLSREDWKHLAESERNEEQRRKMFQQRGEDATIQNDQELNNAGIPKNEGTAWQTYKRTLRNNGFSHASTENLEKQTINILRHLSTATEINKPIKGLVVGNVQSGKTASMAGLMAMAADNGWNFFIVLTGLTENLRNQTEIRLRNDLKNQKCNLIWDYLDYSRLSDRHFDFTDLSYERRIFFTVCLKNSKRLDTVLKFLQKVPRPEDLKIMIIDDEADQGSINTADVNVEKDRKAINRKIIEMVYGIERKTGKNKPFGALNYVSYTATPYANCLNEGPEEGKRNLYPSDFITRISSGMGYFGPNVIFGMEGDDIDSRMNIVNFIPREDVKEIKELEKGETTLVPDSLSDAVLWFICAAAIQRYRHAVKPVSMLIHTSFRVDDQDAVYQAVGQWLYSIRNSAADFCRRVYEEQTEQFTFNDLKRVFPDYEFLDSVQDYPPFEELLPYIRTLVSEITTIRLDEEDKSEFAYNKGLILCEDNSGKNGEEDGKYYRLVYPDKNKLKELGFAPAFIVVGGNTLSRGLTLEGLVTSYFLRNSIQADSLMQMGRWFGYRKGYELLPRIWMTEDTFAKFQFLVDMDEDLRAQISQMSQMGKTPDEFRIALLTSPRASWLKPTARNKSQSAKKAYVDFSGTDMQLLTYLSDPKIIRRNNEILENFMKKLGKPVISELDGQSGIWTGVSYEEIDREVFREGFQVAPTSKTFQETDALRKWITSETKAGHFRNWTVILAGTKPDSDRNEVFRLNPDYSIGKIRRAWTSSSPDRLSMKALTGKRDYVAHLSRNDLEGRADGSLSWNDLMSDDHISCTYRSYIQAAGKADIPLMILYCVDAGSKERGSKSTARKLSDLGITDGFFAMAFVIPGIRGTHKVRMQIPVPADYGDESDED